MPTPREILNTYSKGDPVVYTRVVLVVQAILEGRSPVLEDPESAPVAEDIVANLEKLELEWFQEDDPDWELEEQPGYEDFRDFLREWRRRQVQKRLRWHLNVALSARSNYGARLAGLTPSRMWRCWKNTKHKRSKPAKRWWNWFPGCAANERRNVL